MASHLPYLKFVSNTEQIKMECILHHIRLHTRVLSRHCRGNK